MSFERVEVEWLDSVSDGSWMPLDQALHEAGEEPMHHSCGYLLASTDEYLLLGLSFQEETKAGAKVMVSDTMRIPRSVVRAVHPLRRASRGKPA